MKASTRKKKNIVIRQTRAIWPYIAAGPDPWGPHAHCYQDPARMRRTGYRLGKNIVEALEKETWLIEQDKIVGAHST